MGALILAFKYGVELVAMTPWALAAAREAGLDLVEKAALYGFDKWMAWREKRASKTSPPK